jgi:hypothetical protein
VCDLPETARLSQHLGARSGELRWVSPGFREETDAVRELRRIGRAFRG